MEITANVGTLPYGVGAILQQLIEVGVLEQHPSGVPFLTTYQEWITLPTR